MRSVCTPYLISGRAGNWPYWLCCASTIAVSTPFSMHLGSSDIVGQAAREGWLIGCDARSSGVDHGVRAEHRRSLDLRPFDREAAVGASRYAVDPSVAFPRCPSRRP